MFDIALIVCLLLVVPGWQVWRSRTEAGRREESRTTRYTRAIVGALALAALLATDWITTHRSVDQLGLAWPLPRGGVIGLVLAAVLLVGLFAAATLHRRPRNPAREAKAAEAAAMMCPETPAELRLFLLFVFIACVMWELLYRGFLLAILPPALGTPGAVAVAALAYALAHGVKDVRRFVASLASAIAFTIGYALTASLWWLIVLHIALALLGLWLAQRERANAG